MPFYLDQADVFRDVAGAGFESVLIVPCRFCPAASMAVKSRGPYIEFFRRFLKTASYERLIDNMRDRFERMGIRTSVFRSRLLHQFVLCMWTSRRRNKLAQRASQHDALVVMGCEGAVQTVRDSVSGTSCQVIQGLKTEGLMTVRPHLRLPCNLFLELDKVNPLLRLEAPARSEVQPST